MNEQNPEGGAVPLERIVGPALTYASHIADCTERLMAAMDRFDEADEAVACADTAGEEETATETREEAALDIGEHRRAITNAIYERSEEHTSELQSLMRNSYDVFCLQKKKNKHLR